MGRKDQHRKGRPGPRQNQILKGLKHGEGCTLQTLGRCSEGKGLGVQSCCSRTTLGYTLPKDTYRLPPGETICRDISPYLVIACTQCTALDMGMVERNGHISDQTAFPSQVLITSFRVFSCSQGTPSVPRIHPHFICSPNDSNLS